MSDLTTTKTAGNDGWKQNTSARTDEWRRMTDDVDQYCLISQYEGQSNYCWQTARGIGRLAGISASSEEAMAEADKHLEMPIEEFNNIAAREVLEQITRLEKTLMSLAPNTEFLPGYSAGYEAGFEEARRRVTEAFK